MLRGRETLPLSFRLPLTRVDLGGTTTTSSVRNQAQTGIVPTTSSADAMIAGPVIGRGLSDLRIASDPQPGHGAAAAAAVSGNACAGDVQQARTTSLAAAATSVPADSKQSFVKMESCALDLVPGSAAITSLSANAMAPVGDSSDAPLTEPASAAAVTVTTSVGAANSVLLPISTVLPSLSPSREETVPAAPAAAGSDSGARARQSSPTEESTCTPSVAHGLWRLSAGPLSLLPAVGSLVVYCADGHLQQMQARRLLGGSAAAANGQSSLHAPLCLSDLHSYLHREPATGSGSWEDKGSVHPAGSSSTNSNGAVTALPAPHVVCRVVDVSLQAHISTSNAQLRTPPSNNASLLTAAISLQPVEEAQAMQAVSELQQQQQEQQEKHYQQSATSADELPTPLPHELLQCSDSHNPPLPFSLPFSLPPSLHHHQRPPHASAMAKVYAKRLSASDTAVHGSLSLPRKVALNCLPSLEIAGETPSQRVEVVDVAGNKWTMRHVYRGTPRRHILTGGWTAFATAHQLQTGDTVIFTGEPGSPLGVCVRRSLQNAHALFSLSPPPTIPTLLQAMTRIATACATHQPFTVDYCPCPPLHSRPFVLPLRIFSLGMQLLPRLQAGTEFHCMLDSDDSSLAVQGAKGVVTGVASPSPPTSSTPFLPLGLSIWQAVKVSWIDSDPSSSPATSLPSHISPWDMEVRSEGGARTPSRRIRAPNPPPLPPPLTPPLPPTMSFGSGCTVRAASASDALQNVHFHSAAIGSGGGGGGGNGGGAGSADGASAATAAAFASGGANPAAAAADGASTALHQPTTAFLPTLPRHPHHTHMLLSYHQQEQLRQQHQHQQQGQVFATLPALPHVIPSPPRPTVPVPAATSASSPAVRPLEGGHRQGLGPTSLFPASSAASGGATSAATHAASVLAPQPFLFRPPSPHQPPFSLPPSSGPQPSHLPHPSPSPSLHFVAVPFHAFHQMTLSAMLDASAATSASAGAHVAGSSHFSSCGAMPGSHFVGHNGGMVAAYYSTPSMAPILTGSAAPTALSLPQVLSPDKETRQQALPAGMPTSAAAAATADSAITREVATGGRWEEAAHKGGRIQETMAAQDLEPPTGGITRDFLRYNSHLGPRHGSRERGEEDFEGRCDLEREEGGSRGGERDSCHMVKSGSGRHGYDCRSDSRTSDTSHVRDTILTGGTASCAAAGCQLSSPPSVTRVESQANYYAGSNRAAALQGGHQDTHTRVEAHHQLLQCDIEGGGGGRGEEVKMSPSVRQSVQHMEGRPCTRHDVHASGTAQLHNPPIAAMEPQHCSRGAKEGDDVCSTTPKEAAQGTCHEASPLRLGEGSGAGDHQQRLQHQQQTLSRTVNLGTELQVGSALQTPTSKQSLAVVTSSKRGAQSSGSTEAGSEESGVLETMTLSGSPGEGGEGRRRHSTGARKGLGFRVSECNLTAVLSSGQQGGLSEKIGSTGKDLVQGSSRGVVPSLVQGGGREEWEGMREWDGEGRREGEGWKDTAQQLRYEEDGSQSHHACQGVKQHGFDEGGEGGERERRGDNSGQHSSRRGQGHLGLALSLLPLQPGDLSLRGPPTVQHSGGDTGLVKQGREARGQGSEELGAEGAGMQGGNAMPQAHMGSASEGISGKRKGGSDRSEGWGKREGEGERNEEAECKKRARPAPPPDMSPQVDSWHTTTITPQDDYHTPGMDNHTLKRLPSGAQNAAGLDGSPAFLHHTSSREEGSSSVPSGPTREALASGNRVVEGNSTRAAGLEGRVRSGGHRDGGMFSEVGNKELGLGFHGRLEHITGLEEQPDGRETPAGSTYPAGGRDTAGMSPAGMGGKKGADQFENLVRTGVSGAGAQAGQGRGSSRRVKVFQEGCSVGRAVDLAKVGGYQELLRLVAAKFGVMVDAPVTAEFLQERELGGSEEKQGGGGKRWYLTYEDMDGDLLAVGDDEWSVFCDQVKAMRLVLKGESAGQQ